MFERGFIASNNRRGGNPSSMSIGPGRAIVARRDIRDRFRQPDVDVQTKRRRDLVLEELSQAAMLRIDAPQQLALVEAERDGVIGLPRTGLPCGLLTRQHDRQAIEVGDEARDRRVVEREQAPPDARGAGGR